MPLKRLSRLVGVAVISVVLCLSWLLVTPTADAQTTQYISAAMRSVVTEIKWQGKSLVPGVLEPTAEEGDLR